MILLDTHVIVWLAESPAELSKMATQAIQRERRNGVLAVSDMTLLELARIISNRKVVVKTSLTDFLRAVEERFTVLPVTGSIAERTLHFSDRYPKDPVDRVVGATALVHATQLITKDRKIRESGEVECVW